MISSARVRFGAGILALLLTIAFAPSGVQADHAWGSYHWARSSNPVSLVLGDNVTSDWDSYLDTAVADWNKSSVLALAVVSGGTSARKCRPTSGRIEVCSASYGNTGWLGVAQIWVSGDHITQATTKVNDTYFDTQGYDTPEWRRLVMCQEVGHDFGLDHQDEDFGNANLGTCMDYTGDPAGPPSNEHPNQHDFDELETIYAHLDEGGGGGGGRGGGGRGRGAAPGQTGQLPAPATSFEPGDQPSQWGQLMRANARGAMFELDLGNGQRVFTFVIWA
jgi:hypothetical protein